MKFITTLKRINTYFLFLFLTSFALHRAYAAEIKVTTLSDSGPGSLRDVITSSGIGDTVLIDVKGIINLNSPIFIAASKNVVVIGPYPIHCTINVAATGMGTAFDVDPSAVFKLKGVTITGGLGVNGYILANGQVEIMDCVFTNHTGTANGGGVSIGAAAANVTVKNCSFINNTPNSTTGGGGAFINAGTLNLINCTFYGNVSSKGGGVYVNGGALNVLHCTFFQNEATSGAGGGHVIFCQAGSVTLQNSIFAHNSGPFTECFANISGTWNSFGGNVIRRTPGGFLAAHGTDLINSIYSSIDPGFLPATPVTDGYGLQYLRLGNASTAIEKGVTTGGILPIPPTDCRRAPRILKGSTGEIPDAGALEYTPFTVTSAAGFLTMWPFMNTYTTTGPKYMDFNLSGPININLTSTQSITDYGAIRIMDGYTAQGSAIPGPRDPAMIGEFITPADIYVNFLAPTVNAFDYEGMANGSWVAGIKVDNGNMMIGVGNLETNIHFYGNQFISSSGNGWIGLFFTGSTTQVKVGGRWVHECNVFGGQMHTNSDASGLYANNVAGGFIYGNLVGTTANGLGLLTNRNGIYLDAVNTVNVGNRRNDYSRNVVSGNFASNIFIGNLSSANITGNLIGVDISGNVSLMPTTLFGINVSTNTNGLIGGLGSNKGNIIGGHDIAIYMNGADAFNIVGNYIGISPNTGYPAIPNSLGLHVENNGAGTHSIGNGTFTGRNYICSNNNHGISIINSAGNDINGNFIGLKPDNSAGGNSGWGIQMLGSLSNNNTIQNNIISKNGIDGIIFDTQAGENDFVNGNYIGTDSTGLMAMGNLQKGIHILNWEPNLTINGNLIAANLQQGIHVENGSTPLSINSNTIGVNLTQTASLPNSSGITGLNVSNLNIFGNVVSGNSGDGFNFNNITNSVIKGNYIGTNAANTVLGNSNSGLFFLSSSNVTFGGTPPGDQNTIAYNSEGIFIHQTSSGIEVGGNRFFLNTGRGINLDNGSPLPNDANDVDVSGGLAGNKGNHGQNKPQNVFAGLCGGTTTLSGEMDVDDLSATYIFNVYKLTPGNIDPSGAGEGDTLIGTSSVTTPATSVFNFTVPLGTSLVLGDVLSVTCTKVDGTSKNTSEFSDTVMVKKAYIVNATAGSNVTCFGGANGVATVTHSATIAPITFQWVNASTGVPVSGATSSTASTLTAGNFYCNVIDGTGCTIGSDTITITEPASLSPGLSMTMETCMGYNNGYMTSTPSGGVSPYDFTWQNSSSVTIDTDTDSLTSVTTNLAPGSYTVIVTDNNGCIASAGLNLPASTNFVTANYNTGGSACENAPMSFNDLSTSSPFITGWTWDFGDGSGTSTLQNPNYTYSTAGTYSAELVVTNGSCADSITLIVTVDPVPVADAGIDATICTGGSYTLDGTGSTGSGLSYNWTDVPTLSPVGASSTVSVTPTGTTFYELEVFNGFCFDKDTINVTVNMLDDASFTYADDSICTAAGLQTATPTIPGGTFTVSPPGLSLNSSTGEIDPSTSTPGAYVVSYTTAGPCTNSSNTSVVILQSPTGVISALAPGTWCAGDPGSGFQIDFTGVGPFEFTWSSSSGTSPVSTVASTPYVLTSFSISNVFVLDYVTDLSNGCTVTGTGSAAITIASPLDATITSTDSVFCTSEPAVTLTTVSAGATFGVVGGATGLSLTTGGVITPSTSTPGTYQVYAEFTTPCYSADTILVTINASPVVFIADFHKACFGDTVNFVGTPAGGTWSGPAGLNASSGEWITFSVFPGTYTATYTFTGTNGCTAQDTNLVVLVTPPVVSFTTMAPTYCLGETAVLSGTPSGAGGYFYYNSTIFSGSTFNYNASALGPDSVFYYYVDAVTGCDNVSLQITNVVSAPATPILSAGPYDFCASTPATVSISNPDAVVNWYSDAALSTLVATGASVSSSSFPAGSGAIYVVNSTGGSCISSAASFTYTVYSTAGIDLGGPYTTCPSNPVTLSTTIPSTGVSFYWVNNGTINDTLALNPIVSPITTTAYYVVLSPSALPTCVLTDSVVVTVEQCNLQDITNVFTPDGDGVNDIWHIDGIQAYPSNKVVIFNRWGDKLIEIDDYNNVDKAWDGMYNGNKVAVGTYYYVIEVSAESFQTSGWVQVNY